MHGMVADGATRCDRGVIGWDAAGNLAGGSLAQVRQTLSTLPPFSPKPARGRSMVR